MPTVTTDQPPAHRTQVANTAPPLLSSLDRERIRACRAAAADRHIRQASDAANLADWFAACLDSFAITWRTNTAPPSVATGPLILAANQPAGLAEILVFGHLAAQWRKDLKILAGGWLASVPELKDVIIRVDSLSGAAIDLRNLAAIREAQAHLRAGGCLALFPAGQDLQFRLGKGRREGPWTPHLGGLIRKSQATVLPIHLSSAKGFLFHLAGMLPVKLRAGLPSRELSQRRRPPVNVVAGEAIPFSRVRHFESDVTLTQFIRCHTLALGPTRNAPPSRDQESSQIKAPEPDMMVAGEISRLQESGQVLAAQGPPQVLVATSDQIPQTMKEIGRLREVTFRAVGEGTGRELDLDRFDKTYLQLILWDAAALRIAGGYRMGRADHLLAAEGAAGLYTSTLFRYSPRFLSRLGGALELGRSFICSEYQRHPASLLLLWKGISNWVLRHPHYKLLFGPVSISADYGEASRHLIVNFLTAHRLWSGAKSAAKPRNPFRSRAGARLTREWSGVASSNVNDLSSLITALEPDRKGLPVLLRHYLKLNARILCFNVDKGFSSALDGLILVNLTETEPRLLARYMGDDGARAYLDHHGIWPPTT